ncbi:MAG: hypothetical protein ACTHMI_10590 [Mucilaginibacter sp.]
MDHRLSTKHMNILSIIFWVIFVAPFVAFLIWLMRQDKRRGAVGLWVLAILVVVAIVYMYWKTQGQ